MAVDPPPVDTSDPALDLAGAADEAQTEFWRNLWPWDDLNAKSPPGAWPRFQRDILPTLAALTVVRSPTGPRALGADATGRLLTAGVGYFSDVTTQSVFGPNAAVSVGDISLYSPGQVLVFANAGALAPGAGRDFVTRVSAAIKDFGLPSGILSINPKPPAAINAGTVFLVLEPPSEWLPGAPWKHPVDRPAVPIVVTGGTTGNMVAGTAGQFVYVFAGAVVVTVGSAGAEWRIQDSAGNIRYRGSAVNPGYFNFDLGGSPIGVSGTGLDCALVGAGAVLIFNAATSQA